MEGQLAKNPLAELIAEINVSQISGALRLNHDRIKVAIYFENDTLVFASSNLKSHRLANFLRRSINVDSGQVPELPKAETDEELADIIIQRGILTSNALDTIRQNQVSEVLRIALLWTDGTWNFDPRVRLASEVRVDVDANGLLLECARHLPSGFVRARFANVTGLFEAAESNGKGDLLPEEAFVLSRAYAPATLAELLAISGLDEEQTLRAIYGLLLAGYVSHSDRRRALATIRRQPASSTHVATAAKRLNTNAADVLNDLKAFFARLERANDYYEVLDVGRMTSAEEIRDAYHELARNYHPDRFHQNDPGVRARADAAFARIAQAYETLSDELLRASYDKRLESGQATRVKAEPAHSGLSKAETLFQKGRASRQQGRSAEALRFLSEAAMVEPRTARYRAEYGQALSEEPNNRRLAESELRAAIALEPGNPSYRVILAELYQQNGLRRRAQSELERALAVDPTNQTIGALLTKLKSERSVLK